jgi:hypothetical protein
MLGVATGTSGGQGGMPPSKLDKYGMWLGGLPNHCAPVGSVGLQDSRQGHHDKFDIGNRHASFCCLFLGILHHDHELRDAIHLHVVLGYCKE